MSAAGPTKALEALGLGRQVFRFQAATVDAGEMVSDSMVSSRLMGARVRALLKRA